MSASSARASGSASRNADELRVETGERPEPGIVERVRQAAHVENEIGVEREALLEPERLEGERQPRAIHCDEILDPRPQRVRREVARIEPLAELADLLQQLAFARDRLGDRRVAVTERMRAAGFREALDERLVAGVEKEQPSINAVRFQGAQRARQLGERRTAAGVDRDGDALVAGVGEEVDRRASSVAGRLSTQ